MIVQMLLSICTIICFGELMADKFIKLGNKKTVSVSKIITVIYLENNQDFVFEGEAHDFWEFAYVDKGPMVFVADGKEFLLQSGEMVFHKPNEFHRLEARKLSTPNISVVSFASSSPAMKYFENRIFKLNADEKMLFSLLLKEGLSAYAPLTPEPPIYGMREVEDAPIGAIQLTFSLLEQFLITLMRRSDAAISRKARSLSPMREENYPQPIREIISYMDENITRPLLIKDIAAAFSMSESALKKLFFYEARCGVLECFNNRKLKKAKQLIREGELSMTEIAETVGFNSIHYFSKYFKRKLGVSPTEYKRSVLNR